MRAKLAALLVPVVLLASCGDDDPPEPAGDRLDAGLVEFEPDAPALTGLGATGDAPVELDVVSGWRAADRDNPFYPAAPGDSDDGPDIPDRPGRSYVLVTGSTGCRAAEDAELWRDGDDLQVRFTGGEKLAECARPYTAMAQFEVDSAAVKGVRTVRGEPPLAAAGPGTRTAFVRIGTVADRIAPAELRGAAPQAMYAAIRRARGQHLTRARAALLRKPAAGNRAFAFVLGGCAETGSELVMSRTYLTARLTGGGAYVCEAPRYFLVVYEVPARLVPAEAQLR